MDLISHLKVVLRIFSDDTLDFSSRKLLLALYRFR